MDYIYSDVIKLKRTVVVVALLTQIVILSADADVGADKYRTQAGRILLYSSTQGSSPQSTGQRKIPATVARMRTRNICCGRRVSR